MSLRRWTLSDCTYLVKCATTVDEHTDWLRVLERFLQLFQLLFRLTQGIVLQKTYQPCNHLVVTFRGHPFNYGCLSKRVRNMKLNICP